jgi:hypothetical protein
MAKDKKQPTALPLGRAFRLKELKGSIEKWINVPPGRMGVVVEADGAERTLAPGYHRLLTVYQRLRGQGVGLAAGYVPVGEFSLPLSIPYLLSGDGELVDLSLACALEISDPLKFFKEVVLPQGTLQSMGMEVSDEAAQKTIGAVTTKYAAADLAHGLPPRLNGELLNALGLLATGWGLSVKNIPLVAFSRSEDRLVIAEKTQVLQERLQDIALQAKMVEIENQAQLDEFIQQVGPEFGKVVHPQVNQEKPASEAAAGKKPGEYLRTLFSGGGRGNGRRGGLIGKLFRQKGPAHPKIGRLPRFWWLRRVLWMAVVVLVGLFLTSLVNRLASAASTDGKMGLLLLIWGFVVGVALDSIKVLYEKWETVEETEHLSSGSSRLDDLIGNDRRRADELVREQCQKELQHVREVLQDIRTREFKRDKTDLALKLRNELERNADDSIKKIGNPDYGRPPYVTDLHIDRYAWNAMLNYDEDLLRYANALSDKAHLLQQKSLADELDIGLLTTLDSDISAFCNRFFERGRPIKIVPQEAN